MQLRSEHLRDALAMIGEDAVHFDENGISHDVTEATARQGIEVPGFSLHSGELIAEPLETPYAVVVNFVDKDGKLVDSLIKEETLANLFVQNKCVFTVTLPEKLAATPVAVDAPPSPATEPPASGETDTETTDADGKKSKKVKADTAGAE